MTTRPAPLSPTAPGEIFVGQGAFRYQAVADWARLPVGWSFVEVAGIASDSRGNVLAFNRGEHPVIVFDRDGRFGRSWGEGVFTRPHGITIGPDDAVYCVDDLDHTVRKFTPEGKLLFTLGTAAQPSDTGVRDNDYRTLQRVAGPFNQPTNLALSVSGELYVSDGYGNARAHRFSSRGELLSSWGEGGNGPGQFHLPHGIAIDSQGTVYVADRENSRVQRFTPRGRFIDQWTDVARPCQVFVDGDDVVYVAELGYRAGMFAGNVPPGGSVSAGKATGGRVSVFDAGGRLLSRFGGGNDPCAPGDFFAPHDLWVDRFGDLYVAEVVMSAGGNRGLVDPTCHTLQKFVRISSRETS